MKIWRIGSKWDKEDIFPVFLKHSIAFAGSAVDGYIKQVKPGDIIAITKGQQIIGLAKAVGLEKLISYNLKYRSAYDDVLCIKLSDFYSTEEYKGIDFGLYNGQGKQFHEAHNNYRKEILNLFQRLTYLNMQNELVNILEHKHQIILQGPPGTGKTYTAKQIAGLLTKEKVQDNPKSKIIQYLSERQQASAVKIAARQKVDGLLQTFQTDFPKSELYKLPIDRYVAGKGEQSFCWWIEFGLTDFGRYSGHSTKFKLFWKQSEGDYSKSGFIKNVQDDEQAMDLIADQLQKAVDEQNLPDVAKKLSSAFILKILHSYYPDKYFPINNETCINNALKLLGKEYAGLNVFDKNILLQQTFLELKAKYGSDVTNYEFMRFLFGEFDMKGSITISNDKLVSKGQMKLIQFHPAYTYEDFVRGITTQANENGELEYVTVNKVLAQFAADAVDNPTASYVLIIDEINRANLPAVLGELIYALEYRDDSVDTMYEYKGDNKITLPKNLYIIGTMNTADRSVGHIDYAIRRRFAFKSILPDKELVHKLAQKLFEDVSKLFIANYNNADATSEKLKRSAHMAQDFSPEDIWLGHSYFMPKEPKDDNDALSQLKLKLEYEIKPLLREYVKDGILQENSSVHKPASSEACSVKDYIELLQIR